jgi:hypothetical protein
LKYLPLFHHFKAIYQLPKHIIFLIKIVANASLTIFMPQYNNSFLHFRLAYCPGMLVPRLHKYCQHFLGSLKSWWSWLHICLTTLPVCPEISWRWSFGIYATTVLRLDGQLPRRIWLLHFRLASPLHRQSWWVKPALVQVGSWTYERSQIRRGNCPSSRRTVVA